MIHVDLVVIGIAFVLGIWLTSVFTTLRNISWGSIRKLDPKRDKVLITKAESWLEMRNEYRILLRLLVLLNLTVMAVCLHDLLTHLQNTKDNDFGTNLLLVAVGAYLFILGTELVSAWANHSLGWGLLKVSMPVIYVLRGTFWPITFPAVKVHKYLENSRDTEDEDDKTTTEDEIEALLEHEAHLRTDATVDEDGIEVSTGKMIRGVLDLDETLVKEIMTPRVDVIGVEIDTPLAQVRRSIVESGHSRIPVYKRNIDHIVGVVYSKSMLDDMAITADTSLSDIMHQAAYIPETKNVDDLLQEFKQSKVHMAIVIDEYGGTAGIVSLEDILEEIVGEIADEFDDAHEEDLKLRPARDGSLDLEGRTPIDDVNEALGLSISEEEDNVTIGGYVTSQIGRIPRAGERVELDAFIVDIVEADGRKIDKLVLRLPSLTSGDSTDE